MSTDGVVDANAPADEPDETAEQSHEELLTQVELLGEENKQLRESYTQAKRTQYRRTAFALGLVGLLAVVGAFLTPGAREVLFALGATGVFAGVLTLYLTPEQFIAADVGRDVYTPLAENEAALVSELGLSDQRMYVPTGDRVRLFIPQHETDTLPDAVDLQETIVVGAEPVTRGVALEPSGSRLFRSFEAALTGQLDETPGQLATQLTEALVEQFELVGSAAPEIDADGQRLTVALSGSVYGPVDQFDHPVVSFLAVGLATGVAEPVSVVVAETPDGRADYLVTYRWGDTGTDGHQDEQDG